MLMTDKLMTILTCKKSFDVNDIYNLSMLDIIQLFLKNPLNYIKLVQYDLNLFISTNSMLFLVDLYAFLLPYQEIETIHNSALNSLDFLLIIIIEIKKKKPHKNIPTLSPLPIIDIKVK